MSDKTTDQQRKARRRIQRMIIREENTSDDPFGLHAMAREKAKAEVCCACGAKSTNASWPCTMSPDGEGDHDWVTDHAEGDRQMARWMQNDVG